MADPVLASNLGWKLAGVFSGFYNDPVLDTYQPERRAGPQHIIDVDIEDTFSFISGRILAHFSVPPNADADDYLDQVRPVKRSIQPELHETEGVGGDIDVEGEVASSTLCIEY
ncbi:hypothetical protein C8J56DRAFT_1113613 [Mycena floridula]|nr:hypothetical protein C8J56DRAFT_1113613 [Mycena floridula]